jgi:DNA-binding transcriptional LysR family regulator
MPEPDLADLQAFAAVAQAQSFRAAAHARGVSASALSEAVRRIESRLGVRLLNRTTRSVRPTEAGARLLERLAPALREVHASLDALNGYRDEVVGTLRLNVPTIVARVVLPPLAARFLAAHPRIRLEVVAQDDFVDVLGAGFDAGVRYDERLEQDMIAVPIGPRVQRFVAAAAHAYLETRPPIREPRDLLQHACIRHRFPSGAMPPWEFERAGEVVKVDPGGPVASTTLDVEIEAALAGLGVLYTFGELVEPHIVAGRLVRLLDEWSPTFPGPFLYYAGRRHVPAPLRAFVEFLRTEPREGEP